MQPCRRSMRTTSQGSHRRALPCCPRAWLDAPLRTAQYLAPLCCPGRFKLLHDSVLITDPAEVEALLARRGAEELPKPAFIYSPLDPVGGFLLILLACFLSGKIGGFLSGKIGGW